MQKVKILNGFAKGLEGEATALAGGWDVTVTYPDNFDYDSEVLRVVAEHLFYDTGELEFLDSSKEV